VADAYSYLRGLFVAARPQSQSLRGGELMNDASSQMIVFEDVSKFYGEILGVNRVNLSVAPGITSLVGPNGAGKTTLMNLMTGLLRPTRGQVSILGISPNEPEELFRRVGYCSQFDSFPRGVNGREFINMFLSVHGYSKGEADELAMKALERVQLTDAAEKKVAAYSKGMRQRARLAQAIAHNPSVLILDEPLNGLDPMARAETIRLFRQLADEGLHLVISSHILHEVDMMSDCVVLLNNGYVVAEGEVHGVRDEMDEEHPMQILIRCDKPGVLAARVFEQAQIVEAKIHDDRQGLFIKTRDADKFYLLLNRVVAEGMVSVESVTPVDDDLSAVYQYLIGSETEGSHV
jgi:ABC-2 type transport system ATP-binding protein